MYFLHAINSDRKTRLLNDLGQIAMILGDKKIVLWITVASFVAVNAVTSPKHISFGLSLQVNSHTCSVCVASTRVKSLRKNKYLTVFGSVTLYSTVQNVRLYSEPAVEFLRASQNCNFPDAIRLELQRSLLQSAVSL